MEFEEKKDILTEKKPIRKGIYKGKNFISNYNIVPDAYLINDDCSLSGRWTQIEGKWIQLKTSKEIEETNRG